MHRNLLVMVALAALTTSASAEGWGTIKGQFVIDGGKAPPVIKLDVNKDEAHCLSKGAINSEKYVVGKNGGVRWVVVWIAPENNGMADHKTLPDIHPSLAAIKDKKLIVDQPCCKFEPHVVVMRKGQEFVGKNSSEIAHAMQILGQNGVSENLSLTPGGSLSIAAGRWKTYYYPSEISCGIHPWMKAKLFVLGHPYFAVSDEDGKFEIKNVPAGKLRILMWHEVGWVNKQEGKPGFHGQPITVEDGKTLDVGKVTVKLE
jgi:hypothetical protein